MAAVLRPLTRSLRLLVLSTVFASSTVSASDLIFMNGFGNVTVAITYPADGSTLGTGVPIPLMGSASVPATLVWTSSTSGYLGTGDMIGNAPLSLGFQIVTVKATTADPESAIAEVGVTVVVSP